MYVGGTGVDAPEDTSFSFDTKKIIGTITVLGDATKATAVATDASAISVNGTVKADGKYEIEVGQGTYDVVLGKAGYLYKTYEDVVANANEVDLGTIALIGGDYTGDGKIVLADLQAALTAYGNDSTTVDLNDDGTVTLVEVQAALSNYGAEGY